jgi:glycosyltransferase involved in cell wall biosynthesis
MVAGACGRDDGLHDAMSPPDVRVISRDNNVGLSRDMQLVARVLRDAGRSVDCVGYGGGKLGNRLRELRLRLQARLFGPAPVQLFLERVYPACLPAGRRNLLVPNPEWFPVAWKAFLPRFDRVLCKTRHAVAIFDALGCATRYVGFTSEDRLDPAVTRDRAFFHLAGRSQAKGTQVLLEAWRRHPEWPRLTVVQSAKTAQPGVSAPNIVHLTGHLDDAALLRLQNAHAFHICPSEAEGFGHVLMEALSTRAVVLTTDGAPMHELVTPERGLLITPARTGTLNLSPQYFVDVAGIEAAVVRALALDDSQRAALGAAARRYFEQSDATFRAALPTALD